MGDLTIIILSAMLIILCLVIIKINDKVDRHINRFKKLEKALLKNAAGQIPVDEDSRQLVLGSDEVPMAATSNDAYPDRKLIAKSKTR